jgi:DNA repair protein RadC
MALRRIFGEEGQAAVKTVRLRSIRMAFSRETVREDLPDYIQTTRYTSPRQVYEMFSDLRLETKEHFIALHLDGKNRIVCFDRVSVGSLNQSIVHPREVFKGAILSSAAAIILMHNHPTGDPTPSQEDLAITRRLAEVGELVGIRVLDHIIVGDGEFLSFAERGLL